jgi:MBG domain/Bacterial Ig-like domain (group 3)/Putative Ig domain
MNAASCPTRPLSSLLYNQRHPNSKRWLFLLLAWLSSVVFAQTTTTISGTVYMPNGTVPLPDVLVYVTTGTVTLPASGATCTSSSVTAAQGCITSSTITPVVVTSGTGVYAYTTSAVDGTFTLSGVPEGSSYTLVIQSGKWINEFAEPSSGTLSGPISGLQLSMPTTHSATANIPLIAIQTGSADALECVFRDIGVASTEFTDDSVTSGASFGGRIHLYKGNGAEISSNTPSSTSLQTQAKLNSYDMVMFPCEGGGSTGANSTTIPYLINYTSLGGRLFTTHNSDAWLDTTNTGANGYYFYSAEGSSPMTWGSAANSVTPDPGYALINTSFSDGNTLASWLYQNGYSYGASGANTGTENKVEISTLRFNVDTVNAPAQAWLTFPSQASQTYNVAYNGGSPIMQFSFNTPWGASAANQFGRVLYNEYHVENVSESGSPIFPAECPTLSGASQVPQEKMLEFAIFDLSAAVTPVVLPTASIAITTNPGNSIFNEGDTTDTITVDVTNTSSTVALPNNLTLAVTLPDGLTATAMADSSSGNWICTVGTLTCTNASGIAPNASDAITITVTVSGSAAGSNASVTGSVSATVSSPNFSSNVTGPLTITLDRHAAVTWATPAAITAGTPLSSTQLNAVGNTAGTYVYTLSSTSGTVVSSGTVLPAGVNTLWVTFTASDSDSYPGTATASVTLTVNSTTASVGNPAPVSLGSEPVGSSTTQSVTFTFTGAGSIGTPLVVTQGATGLDFTDAGTGTCDTNGSTYAYSISGTCTVVVTFAPRYPGLRYGAALLRDASGNVLATAYLTGTGTGAQVLFPPGTQTMLTPDLYTYWPEGLAVDAQFNLFFVDGNSNSYEGAVLELPWVGSSYGAVLAPSGLALPGSPQFPSGAMAEDGAGNLYVGMLNDDSSTGSIFKFPWSGSAYGSPVSLGSGLVAPTGIAVDGAGNLFVSDSAAQLIAELPWSGSSSNNGYGSQVTLANSTALGGSELPQGIAVDSAENIFFVAANSTPTGELVKIPFVSGSYSASFVTLDSTLFNPFGITIDPNGNIYVADSTNSGTSTPVYEYVLSSGTYAPRTQLFTTPYGGSSMTLDGAGNLYIEWNSGDGGGALYKQNRNVLPDIVFPTATAQGTADTADNPLSFVLLNYGNANLSIASAAISTGSGSFSFDTTTACPKNGGGNLAANVSCLYAMDFTPASTGSIPGSLLLTDNNLNVSAATQTVSLSGTATGPSSLTFTLPASTTLPAGAVAAVYSVVTFQATGGTSPYHYAISGGALPAGMSLSTTGLLTGTPTAGGVFTITVLATDADSVTGAQTYSLTILPPTVTIAPSTVAAASVGTPYTQTFTAAGGTGPYTYALPGTLPSGLSFSPAGILSGTPSAAGGPYTFTVTATDSSTGTGPYSGVSTTYSLTVGGSGVTATVTLGNLAQTYTGFPLSATASTLPAGLSVTLTYNGSATPPSAPGSYTVVATITSEGYQGTAAGTLIISKAPATVTLGNLTRTYTGSPQSVTATTAPAGRAVIITYNGSMTPPTAGGSYTVVATISDSDYTGSATGTMTIAPLTPAIRVSSSSNPAIATTAVTFTAIASSSVGTPTGTVSFLDSTTPLGQATISAGVATLSTSSLADGSHSIIAMYSGDTNFVAVASAALPQSILDFSLTPGSGGSGSGGSSGSGGGSGSSGGGSGSSVTTQTAEPGGTATYPLNIIPSAGTIFPTAVLLTVTGLPAGATAVITPSSWAQLSSNSWTFPANTPLPSITLVVQLPPASTGMTRGYPGSGKLPSLAWGVLLLPFAVRMRRAAKRLRGIIFTLLLTAAGLGAVSSLSSCTTGNGFFGQQQSSYTVTVTATSGPLTRSTNLTLNVE